MEVQGTEVQSSEVAPTLEATPGKVETLDPAPIDPENPAPEADPESPPEETPPPEAAELSEEEKAREADFERRFQTLTRREKMLVDREKAAKEELTALSNLKKMKEDAHLNPMPLLEELGWTFEDLTQMVLNDNQPPAERKAKILEERLAKIEAERQKDLESRQTAEEEAVIEAHKDEIKKHVTTKGDDYELIQANDAYELVYDVIEAHYEEHGEIIPIADASDKVESYLEEQAKKLLSLKKFRSQTEETTEASPSPDAKPDASTKTLTNTAANSITPPEKPTAYLSDEESKARAAELLRKSFAG